LEAIPTNEDLTLLRIGCPAAQASDFKSDVEANYHKALDLDPAIADRIRAANREARFAGGRVPNFFRKPFGPGWARVGDAGYTKDPITGQGMSDAIRDAELCASALNRKFTDRCSFDQAMCTCQQTRDERMLPIYQFTSSRRSSPHRGRCSSSWPRCTATKRPWTGPSA
jgi:flavin-dependent dehydrogenase